MKTAVLQDGEDVGQGLPLKRVHQAPSKRRGAVQSDIQAGDEIEQIGIDVRLQAAGADQRVCNQTEQFQQVSAWRLRR